ncbi:hypothetical protein DNHGIG_26340 [Collibacillus ludicampi]|uniref:Uncharacterized protein n=1 Tax=Collibacillus ludicampi TaxID=2771369 RepID=A0AAV4LH31_9BACL|nr:hypothetical protein [Collibacillus ludicampi]GIM47085.1 hypothetical protein DNHGIG_26340 [Collibacillus ludicampi]
MQVYFADEAFGVIPYSSFPAFRLLCEQLGFQTKWNEAESTLHLLPGLTGKTVCLAQGGSRDSLSFEKKRVEEQEILTDVKNFLASSGIHCIMSDEARTSTQTDLYIQLTVSHEPHVDVPQLIVIYDDWNVKTRKLARFLFKEFECSGIPCMSKTRVEADLTNSFLDIQCRILDENQQTEWATFRSRLAVSLASSILRYFQDREKISILSCLSPKIIYHFLELVVNPEREQQEVQDEYRLATNRLQAEVYFDYSIHVSASEKQPHLIIGNLSIKNTGTEDLYNPVIYLRVTPPESIKLRGQILPPQMTESLSIQSAMGKRGWKYLEEDWFQKVHEQGEYWIGPIDPIRIGSQEVEILNFQLSVTKPAEGNQVMVEGFVFFQEKQIHFPSNNRIIFSYLSHNTVPNHEVSKEM